MTGLATAPPTDSGAAPAGAAPSGRSRRVVAALVVPLLLLAVAGTLRFYRLGEPPRIYFDEVYYVEDARQYLARGVEAGFAVHPPVGKWLIAGGMAIFGDNPFGWRAAVAAAGTATVLGVYLVGLRLFRRRGVAALAALLLTVEGLAFTMSRIAMLDAIVTMFIVFGFWLLLVDRDRQWAALPQPVAAADGEQAETKRSANAHALPLRPHPYRWLAGVVFGLAVATKWSALLAIGAAGLFVLVGEALWRRQVTGRWHAQWWRAAVSAAVTLLAVPALVYVASYAPWFANVEQTRLGPQHCPEGVCALSAPEYVQAWWDEQGQVLSFHLALEADHPYRASPATWPLMTRPVAYYYESCNEEKLAAGECEVAPGNVAEVLGMGNPAVWWPAMAALLVLGWMALRRLDWRAWALLAFVLVQYLPWLATTRPAFLFYMSPIVPFLCLGLAYAAWQARRDPLVSWLPWGVAAVAVAGFLYWYPLLAGMEIPKESWELRIWMRSWI